MFTVRRRLAAVRHQQRAAIQKSRVDDGLLAELAPIRMQLLRIGRNLNQAMKAANAAMLETGDKQIEPELRRIADMR